MSPHKENGENGATSGAPPHAAAPSWILALRERLASPPPARLPARRGAELRPAAVLVPLYVDAGALWTLLTQRSETLPHHKGQIAFPGGGGELGEEAWDIALRESEEELGIDRRRVLRLGALDQLEASSGYRIAPCVGAVPWPLELRPNRAEIDDVFSVPLDALANPRLVEERKVLLDGVARSVRVYHLGGRTIWGLTARILHNLLARLGMAEEPMDSAEPARS